jgi:hypothetical protein
MALKKCSTPLQICPFGGVLWLKKALTLALSQRERGLFGVAG